MDNTEKILLEKLEDLGEFLGRTKGYRDLKHAVSDTVIDLENGRVTGASPDVTGASPDVTGASPDVTAGTNDPVNHPSHYTDGKIEVIDFIEDKKLGFHLGNTVKYVARAGKKDPSKTIQDLEKAAWYLNRKIEKLKAEEDKVVFERRSTPAVL